MLSPSESVMAFHSLCSKGSASVGVHYRIPHQEQAERQRGFQNNCVLHELPRKVRSCANATGALQINDKCEDRTCHHTTLIV